MGIQKRKRLTRNLSPIGAWAFALGTSIGWGSLVVTANTYLAQAGPVGSVIGLVLGAIIMLVVCQNYAYMMSCYPDAGGVYSFCRECFGYDHGFLAAWFLMLTYLAMLWANATSLPLFARFFSGIYSVSEECTSISATVCIRARTGACASCLSELTSECTKTKNA